MIRIGTTSFGDPKESYGCSRSFATFFL